MVLEIRVASEVAELDVGPSRQAVGFFVEEQDGRPLQVAAVEEAQLVEKNLVRLGQQFGRDTAALRGSVPKRLERLTRQVGDAIAGSRRAIPRAPLLAQEEALQVTRPSRPDWSSRCGSRTRRGS